MSASQSSITAVASTETSAHARLRNAWLTLARVSWVVVVLPTIVLFALGLLVGFGPLRTICTDDVCRTVQLSPEQAELHQQLGLSLDFYAGYTTLVFAAFGLVFFAVAALVFWRRSHDWMALLVSFFLVLLGAGAMPVIESVVLIQPQLGRMGSLMFLLAIGLLPAIFGLFPDGRFVPRWMRWLALAGLVRLVLVATTFTPPSGAILSGPPSAITVGMLAAGIGAQVYRYRRVSTPLQRQQTKWAVFGFGAFLVYLLIIILADALIPALTAPGLTSLVFELYVLRFMVFTQILIIPVTLAISILRYRLWDVDFVINRALVYGALTAIVVGMYVLVVGALGALFQTRGSLLLAILATGFAALLFQPLRQRLQHAVNRLMYGERDDPYVVLSRLGQRLEGTLAPEAVLPIIVETVAQTLKLPYAAISLAMPSDSSRSNEAFPIVAAYGSPTTDPLRLPLVYQAETIGVLIVGPRAGESFSSADRRLLDDLARQAGVAVHAVRLTADLQRSRERLVTAREEESRRLRRDLHDGLGSQLAALHLRAGTLRTLIPHDLAAADAGVVELQAEIRAAIADIRRLVYELRPPALDELGLAGALRGLAAQCTAADGLQVRLDVPEQLPPLPAAVEVAAYRIAQEALTNVVRHARARTCEIRLMLADDLRLEIKDDGIGLSPEQHAGVGLRSMHERAAELGGTWAVETLLGGGTKVRVRLPLPPAKA